MKRFIFQRTRAEAMLEKIRLQPKHIVVDPLDNARSWNIPIYSLELVGYFARI